MLTYPAYQIDYVISALEHECERPAVEFKFDDEAASARYAIADWIGGTLLEDLLERVDSLRDAAECDREDEADRAIEREAIRHLAADIRAMLNRRLPEVAAEVRDEGLPDLDLEASYVTSAEDQLREACDPSPHDERQLHLVYAGPKRGFVRAPIIDDLIRHLRTGT